MADYKFECTQTTTSVFSSKKDKIVLEIDDEVMLEVIRSKFDDFLRACGFVIPYDDEE